MKTDGPMRIGEAAPEVAHSSDNGLFVASVEKAFRVLSLFADARGDLGLTHVAARSGIGRSASQRFLYTLTSLGYLNQDPSSKAYRLSSKLLALSQSYPCADVLKERAYPILEAANRACEETINLTILEGTDVTYILRFESKHVLSVNLVVGMKLPAFCTAPGRVMLAYSNERRQDIALAEPLLVKRTETTEVDPARLREILHQTRRKGYALSNQEAFVGDISVAAPVFDRERRIAAAVNIAVPFPRWSVARAQRTLAPIVRQVGQEVSAALAR
jgi:IclR family pca regulon transcriptional regulator